MDFLTNTLRRLVQILALIAGLSLLTMMLVTCVDVRNGRSQAQPS